MPGTPGPAAPGIPQWNPPAAGYPVSGRSRKGLWIGLGIGAVCVAGVIIAVIAVPGSNSSSGSATGTASPTAPSSASPGASGQALDGTAYKQLLASANALPAGWRVQDENDSGAGMSTDNTDDVGTTSLACTDALANSASELLDYQATYSEAEIQTTSDDTPDVSLTGFLPGNAARALADVRKLAARCQTFNGDSLSPGTYTTAVVPVTVSGADQALIVKMTTPSGSNDFSDSYWLFAQYGNTIVGADEIAWSPSESKDTQDFPSVAASLGKKAALASANG